MSNFSNNKRISNISCGVYKIPCSDCDKMYLGETGRDLNVRVKEHKRDVINAKPFSGVSDHSHKEGHTFDFDNSCIVYVCNNLSKRRIVESALIKNNKSNYTNLNEGFISFDAQVLSIVNSCIPSEVHDKLSNC